MSTQGEGRAIQCGRNNSNKTTEPKGGSDFPPLDLDLDPLFSHFFNWHYFPPRLSGDAEPGGEKTKSSAFTSTQKSQEQQPTATRNSKNQPEFSKEEFCFCSDVFFFLHEVFFFSREKKGTPPTHTSGSTRRRHLQRRRLRRRAPPQKHCFPSSPRRRSSRSRTTAGTQTAAET